MKNIILLITLMTITQTVKAQEEDKFIWLEEVDAPNCLEWVAAKNKASEAEITAIPSYQKYFEQTLATLNSSERIAAPSLIGKYAYNFWQDKENPRGLWRRMLKTDYLAGKQIWETVLDIDALSITDNKKWVYKGASPLPPNNTRFLVNLSNGGGDATVVKEFDAVKKQFVKGGFELPESKGGASWIDINTLWVSRDFGSNTMTSSGYPMQTKIWKRGTPLSSAKLIFEGKPTDVSVSGYAFQHLGKTYQFVRRGITFYTGEAHYYNGSKLIKLDIPSDASLTGMVGNQALIELKSDWKVGTKVYKQGSILAQPFAQLIAGKKAYTEVITPQDRTSIESVSTIENDMLVAKLVNVKSELYKYSLRNGKWTNTKLDVPSFGAINLGSSDNKTGEYTFYYQNFLNPSSLYYANINTNKAKLIKSLPNYFDASPYEVKQFESTPKDGTKIPYFLVARKDVKLNGTNPVVINAYGGFEVSRLPFYSASFGQAWLDDGGVFVLANIRGGGEFGPAWHQSGLKENRQRIYDDLHSVAENLIDQKYTSPKKIGVMGGSNGGLLVGVAFTQRPDLYGAVVCQVPLLDMKRYNKLLAGASWMGEYGDPDIPEQWEYISKYSPYQNLKPNMDYPEVFFTTSTRDDRVHPGHARKMVAKMEDMGYKVYYYENTEGGHAGSSTNEQRAKSNAMTFAYLRSKLGE